jgi:5-methylcytosine-specific restriction endonuclease McrA
MPPETIRKVPIHPVQERDDYICQYCGKDGLASPDNWHDCTVDHVVPRRHGGTDTDINLVTSCSYCNAIKGQRYFSSFEEAREYVLRRRQELEATFRAVVKAVRGSAPPRRVSDKLGPDVG